MEHSEGFALGLRQFDARTVATLETFFVDAHFLAFEFRRDAAHEDDGLSITDLCKQFLMGGGHLVLDVEA